jgi:hypothetical protein
MTSFESAADEASTQFPTPYPRETVDQSKLAVLTGALVLAVDESVLG